MSIFAIVFGIISIGMSILPDRVIIAEPDHAPLLNRRFLLELETGQSEELNDLNYIKFGIQLATHFLELFILVVLTKAATEESLTAEVIPFAESPTAVIYEMSIPNPMANLIHIFMFFLDITVIFAPD
jgi:hypothetical protein